MLNSLLETGYVKSYNSLITCAYFDILNLQNIVYTVRIIISVPANNTLFQNMHFQTSSESIKTG